MEIARCARILGCEATGLPFKYLGIPVGANMSLKRNWQPVVEKLHNKLSDWKAKTLSFGGRLTLIKAVMGSLPLYYFSIFKAPRSIIDLMEKLRRKFLWGGTEEKNKICWVPWNVVLGPKDKGGLDVGSFYALNMALLMKWFWRFKNDSSSLWRRVVCGIHNSHQKSVANLAKKTLAGVWFRILKIIPELESLGFGLSSIFYIKIGSGENTLFWLDNWLGGGSLNDRFPTLFDLDKKKRCLVADRVASNQLSWGWKKTPKTSMEITELVALSDLLSSINISGMEDKWRSKLSSDGDYYVHDLRHLIDIKVTIPASNPMVWLHLVPLKIICFVWRAYMDRIPSAMALARRGIHVGSNSCVLCNAGSDEADHFLINCPFTAVTMKWIFNWCGVQIQPFTRLANSSTLLPPGATVLRREFFIAMCYGLLWCTWKARNDVVFNKVHISPFNLADNIVPLWCLALLLIGDLEYLYASNANVSNFVSVKLSGKGNYHLWKTQMLCLMETHDMCHLVDAAFDTSSSTKIMKQYDSLLKGWIFGSVSEVVLGIVIGLDSAKEIWIKLESFCDSTICFEQGMSCLCIFHYFSFSIFHFSKYCNGGGDDGGGGLGGIDGGGGGLGGDGGGLGGLGGDGDGGGLGGDGGGLGGLGGDDGGLNGDGGGLGGLGGDDGGLGGLGGDGGGLGGNGGSLGGLGGDGGGLGGLGGLGGGGGGLGGDDGGLGGDGGGLGGLGSDGDGGGGGDDGGGDGGGDGGAVVRGWSRRWLRRRWRRRWSRRREGDDGSVTAVAASGGAGGGGGERRWLVAAVVVAVAAGGGRRDGGGGRSREGDDN
ncbi:hypothetical protein OSB04_013698 [Centaurea solstitialis]|uniref:Reverse transcriptase zinc-binding domain-containing protein n=1 Tax=Centaurea solstitialis TaxID=347529 RepID=A0AA38WQS3_9ASTR|nr:hypothetical protein OSB04_013698 [Centaurea solstitialis]